jgi:hypothetical protein
LAKCRCKFLYHITDAAWPLSTLVLIIVGIVALFARTLQGWARFVALACGLWLPYSIAVGGLLGITVGQAVGGIHVMLGWLLLGYVIRNGGAPSTRN